MTTTSRRDFLKIATAGAAEMNQTEKAKRFAKLHVKGSPLLLYNAWDAGRATTIVAAGAQAIATPVCRCNGGSQEECKARSSVDWWDYSSGHVRAHDHDEAFDCAWTRDLGCVLINLPLGLDAPVVRLSPKSGAKADVIGLPRRASS